MNWISTVTVDASGIRCGGHTWEWFAVEGVTRSDFLVAGRVTFRLMDGTSLVAWGSGSAAKALRSAVEERLSSWALASKARLLEASATLHAFLDGDCYLSHWRVATYLAATPALPELIRVAHRLAQQGDVEAAQFEGLATSLPATVARRNEIWSAAEQERWRLLFETVEATPLTQEQRKAVVDFETRNLLVAAAGSGKSSTLVAKVAYALRKGLVRPEEVLALAFNRTAAQELRERIAARLRDIEGAAAVCSETFHGLGYRILAQERRPTVLEDRPKAIADIYERLRQEDEEFGREATGFILQYSPDLRDQAEFSSYREYLEYFQSLEGRAREVGRGVGTLSGHQVASLQEMRIANWLLIHGVRFEYERSYPFVEAATGRRGYKPDFYYPDIDVWHEHFGVDANGQPPPFFQNATEYLAGMRWKRECHRRNGTRLIETTSAMFSDETIFASLERALRNHGQPLRQLTTQELDALLDRNAHRNFAALLAAFIAHWKSRRVPFEQLMEQGSARDRAFLPVCRRLYEEYTRHLEQARSVDFEDLIHKATERVRRGEWASPFKLILVDEFQDISADRAEFLKALLSQHDAAVLFCVGDDWQAINGFAGSELAIMRNFEREFGQAVVNRLTRTFRSNQGITDAAKAFIERNPAQFRKEVMSHDRTVEDCIRIVRCRTDSDYHTAYEAIATELTTARPIKVRILGRYRKQERRIVLEAFKQPGRKIEVEFDTVHASKGLQADYVILDRVERSGRFTFPSTVLDDSVLRLVVPERETFPNAEERRLLYVALTRAKHRVYILTKQGNESAFVGELEGTAPGQGQPEFACPYCKGGAQVIREGKFGQFRACSRNPNCRWTATMGS